jgi:hypothetical protein
MNNSSLKIIGFYQSICGVFWFGLILNTYLKTEMTLVEMSISLGFLLVSIIYTVGGILMIKELRTGIFIVFLTNLIQVFAFASSKITYGITTGIVVSLKYDSLKDFLGFDFSPFQIVYVLNYGLNEFFFISINFIPLAICAYCLYKLKLKFRVNFYNGTKF